MEWISDHVFLSRLQFAVTTLYHMLWPLISIGLSAFLVLLEYKWMRTQDMVYYRHFRFWSKIFFLSFAMGVISGLPLEFQFGTNWAPFSDLTGNYFGQVLSIEGASAFMLESAFLYLMLFGWNRISPRAHFFSTCMVAFAASLSAFWIMSANSWMQTPAGGVFENGRFILTDYFAALFNPDAPVAFAHMWVACLESTLFLVGGVSAWYILKGRDTAFFARSFRFALLAALAFAPLQVLLGDASGLEIAHTQPAKVAAIEAHWETNLPGEGAWWALAAWPDPENERNAFEIRIPYVLSLLVTHTLNGTVPGLKDFPRDERPPIVIPFYTFRGMVGIGFALFGLTAWTFLVWRRGGLEPDPLSRNRLLLTAWIMAGPLGFVATELGWITREVGRQPWIVYGQIRTADAASQIPSTAVGTSLLAYVALYTALPLLFGYVVRGILRKGPDLTLEPPARHVRHG